MTLRRNDDPGRYLLELFEFVASGKWSTEADGTRTKRGQARFLQVSGFNVVVDPDADDGRRIRQLLVRCSQCRVPRQVFTCGSWGKG